MPALLLTRVACGILLLISAALGYLYYQEREAHTADTAHLSESITALEGENAELTSALAETTEAKDALSRELQAEIAKTASIEESLGKLSESVDTLEKLQYTDPELLAKYSKVYFLNENYAPPDLAQVPGAFSYPETRAFQVHARVAPFLERLIEEAEEDGISLRVASAYRSFGTQAALKSGYIVTYGSGANRFSADQGYSEHQLGTTLDLTTEELGSAFTEIESTEAFAWLVENAHRYGFVLSYPKGNTYYQYEPWHWRFVGRDLAGDLHKSGKHLYDLDQREIDAYLVTLFD